MEPKSSRQANGSDALGQPAVSAFQAWVNLNRPVIAAMTEINGKLIEQFSRANNEWIGFLGRRINEDLAASKRLMDCKSMPEVFEAYQEFAKRAQQHYSSEVQYFARLNQNIADETATIVRTHLEEAAQELRH